jgi:hypothetical protein
LTTSRAPPSSWVWIVAAISSMRAAGQQGRRVDAHGQDLAGHLLAQGGVAGATLSRPDSRLRHDRPAALRLRLGPVAGRRRGRGVAAARGVEHRAELVVGGGGSQAQTRTQAGLVGAGLVGGRGAAA